MSLLDKIPMPGTGFEGFAQGSELMNKLLNAPLERRNKESEIKSREGSLDINKGYLAVAKQGEQRAQTLMPYMIQKYKDIHGKNMSDQEMTNLYRTIIKDALLNPENQNQPGNQPGNQSGNQPGNQPGMQPPMQSYMQDSQQPPDMASTQPWAKFSPMQQEGMAESKQPSFSPMMDQGKSPIDQFQSMIQPQNRAPIPNNNMNKTPQNAPVISKDGDEEIIRDGNPKLNKLDAIAGLPRSPVEAPKVEIDRKNGFIYTRYPSGKITRQKMEGVNDEGNPYRETPEEREARENRKLEKQEQIRMNIEDKKTEGALKKINKKEADKIETSVKPIVNISKLANEANKILDENPGLTGMRNYISKKTRLSKNKDLARLDYIFGKIQTELGHYANPRGGIQTIKWIGTIKPDIFNDSEYNKGMLNQMLDNFKDEYNQENERYKEKVGKNLSVKFPGSNKMVTVEKPDGTTIQLPEEGAEKLVADHPNHRILSQV